jgi:glycoside hydrolase-like protein
MEQRSIPLVAVLRNRVMRATAYGAARLASLVLPIAVAVVCLCGASVASARASSAARTIDYRGYTVTVPRSWPVYDLARAPQTCVRFNRHALYLGTPDADQRCPAADAVGRTEAILIEPIGASAARAGTVTSATSLGGSAATFVVGSAGVKVTATWRRDRRVVALALHRPNLRATPAGRPRAQLGARTASAHQASANVYTGPGFDACYAPSAHAMSAWGSSPYRAVGIYIGGVNAACPPSNDPNLTPSWITNEAAAGWHFIPTYVGLQAPSNSCGCSGITPSQASVEGTADAQDAVNQAKSLGIAPGSPIYDDMEFYPRNNTNTSAVLAYLSSWTSQLHTSGYLSGVYGNADSAITDLVNQYGTTYLEPDDIWIADWNGQATTSDSYVPSAEWANHQRLHQYNGGHNETYGGVTINIDSNYLDSAVAYPGAATATPVPAPTLTVSPAADGTTQLSVKWSGGVGLASWSVLAGPSQTALTTIVQTPAQGQQANITVRSAAPYFAVEAIGSSGQVLAYSSTVPTPSHVIVYGHSAFVNGATGTGGIPAGCYTGAPCHVTTTISVGRTTIAQTGTELIVPSGAGILYFTLTPQGRTLLRDARGARLAVKVTTRDTSGTNAISYLTLIPFSTSGRGPSRSVTQSNIAHVVGMTDFVYSRGAGGILAGCATAAPCPISATLSVGRAQIAKTGPELVGGGELGYLFFSLTPKGRALLAGAAGNQLGVTVTLSSGSAVALARITLVQFS